MFQWECDYCAQILRDDDRAILNLKRLGHVESGCLYMNKVERAREVLKWADSWQDSLRL